MAQESSDIRWNVFARTLDDTLRRRGKAISRLDDDLGLAPSTVARLQHSLRDPAKIAVLNPDDLDAVIERYALSADEIARLRAAVLAAAIQQKLLDRISPKEAREAAEQALEALVPVVRDPPQPGHGLHRIREHPHGWMITGADTEWASDSEAGALPLDASPRPLTLALQALQDLSAAGGAATWRGWQAWALRLLPGAAHPPRDG